MHCSERQNAILVAVAWPIRENIFTGIFLFAIGKFSYLNMNTWQLVTFMSSYNLYISLVCFGAQFKT